jgi:GMP synthase (glutamine-hydrolysing)
MEDSILILDFGSQYTQLIARRVRELNVYCEIHPYNQANSQELMANSWKGIILSGSPFSVYDTNAPEVNLDELVTPSTIIKSSNHQITKLPLLGVCYGAQLMAHKWGGKVERSNMREYGRASLNVLKSDNELLKGISPKSQVWMSHADTISAIPKGATLIASTNTVKDAAFQLNGEDIYGIQFHPEVFHSTEGPKVLYNFVVNICGCSQTWTPDSFIDSTVKQLQEKIGDDKVVLGLSGGVDSSVAAVLLNKAIGKNLYCIFVDNGLLRKNEFENVLHSYHDMGLNVKGVDAKNDFYAALKGIEDPEKKRKAIGRVFIEVFDKEAHKVKNVKWLAQGTIYPDVIESVSVKGPSMTIKSHHNVGGLPAKMKLKIVEPLNTLFKDEVRKVGKALGVDEKIIGRHPFPGPGLAIRILGDITPEKVRLLQEADAVFIDNLISHNLYHEVWQAGVILLPVRSVGIMGDERTYENVVALRAVTSTDGMTADWCHLPYDVLGKISNDIINKVKGINRVVYDISSKPPATIEWE